MPFRIDWLVEQHLVYINVHGVTTVDDLQAYDEYALRVLDNSPHPLVHTIYDYTHAQIVPPLQATVKMKAGKHPNVGWVIFVNMQDIMTRFILSTASQVFRLRFRSFKTLEEALDFIQAVDSTLPNLRSPAVTNTIQAAREAIVVKPV
jgi:hypothetical protein